MSVQKEKSSTKKIEKKSDVPTTNKHLTEQSMGKQTEHKKHDKLDEPKKEKTSGHKKEKTSEPKKNTSTDHKKEKTSEPVKEVVQVEAKKEQSDKPKKPSKYAGVDKGDKKNKETAYAELNFDVKETKRWMAKYFKTNANKDYVDWLKNKRSQLKLEENPDAEIDEEKLCRTSIKNAHFALGFIEEILCIKLVDLSSEDAKKSKVKTYVVSETDIRNIIRFNNDLNHTFGRFLDLYNSDEDYEATMKLSRKVVYKFIDERSAMGTSVQLDDHALNMLLFILHQNRVMLSVSAYNKMMYSKKSSVDYRSVMYSIFDHYTGRFRDLLYKKLESKIKLFAKTNFSDDEEGNPVDDDKLTKVIMTDSEDDESDDE